MTVKEAENEHTISEHPSWGGGGRPLRTRPGVSIPLSNEIAAVFIGQGLTHPDTTPEGRAEAEKKLAQFENFKVVYEQNTADEMNIVVPYFPELEREIEKITEEQLEEIAGGEIFISVGVIGLFFAKLGVMLGVGYTIVGVGIGGATAGAALTSVLAGVAAVGIIAANITLAVGAVATGLGVGVAAGLGHFGSSGSGAVSVNLAS